MNQSYAIARHSSLTRLSRSFLSASHGRCSAASASSTRSMSGSTKARSKIASSGLVQSRARWDVAFQHPSAPPIAQFHAGDRSPRQFVPPSTDEEASAHLKSLFSGLDFPAPAIRKIITHPSWKAGTEGHNNRLAFLGRRVLNSSLVLFLHEARLMASTESGASGESRFNPQESEMSYQAVVDSVLDSYPLGGQVGRAWDVDRVTRWISALPQNAPETAKSSGKNAARAATIEAIVGFVFHQYGATTAHRLFHTRILPHLKPLLESSLQPYADKICNDLGGLDGPLLEVVEASSMHTSPGGSVLDAEPLRKRASAAIPPRVHNDLLLSFNRSKATEDVMYAHAQRKHAIQSLDDLLKVLIAYSYFLDPYMIRFLVRSIAQIQLGQLKDVDPSMGLRILLFCLVLIHLGPVGRHFFQPLESTDMLLLDFIGRLKPAPQYLVAFVDVAIFLLQVIMLFIAYETVRQHPDLPDPLAPSRPELPSDNARDPDAYPTCKPS
ncbi:hypothetical protein FRC05_007349 [Tulasnella sp. 425]|nr:hypothetical protein FRC05_007349 [Tulasnella sp. 425]